VELVYLFERFKLTKSFLERLIACLDHVAKSLDVLLLLTKQRRHLGGLVIRVFIDNAHRTDDCTATETEVIAALAAVLLTVQRLGRAERYVVTSHRLTEKHSANYQH